ncbi:hypothetical protein [Dactylosporangium sp. NPDC051541]|uniref:hypothetical protein n=1 Tax=Dactylosporangium sp. NPDC051541 TaxID=3363977 RepID=UPI0037AAE74A
MTSKHHYPPALILFLLAPLLAEYLLGNIPLGSTDALAAYLPVAMLYGAGALIIRECAVRAGRGWPTIAVLAVAYGVIEEGAVTQSLFNPSYVDLNLNQYGTIPGTGTGAPWALYVLTLHCVWSITVPIAVVQALFPAAAGAPWLPRPLLAATAVPYLLGAALLGVGTHLSEHFLATPGQLAATGAIAVVLVVLAFLLPRPRPAGATTPWSPAVLAGVALLCGTAFFLLYIVGVGGRRLAPPAYLTATLALEVAVAAGLWLAATRTAWTARHTFGVATGGVLTYAWAGVYVQRSQYDSTAATGIVQAAVIAAALAILVVAARRSRAGATPPPRLDPSDLTPGPTGAPLPARDA